MSDESLFREVDEEVRQEQYKKLWDRFGFILIALCAAVVVGVGGVKVYQYYQEQQAQNAAVVYFDAVNKATAGKPDDAIRAFEAVNQSGFHELARLQRAIVLSEQGKTQEAVAAFDAVAADASVYPTLRELARIRAGYLLVDTSTPDELLSRLGSFDNATNVWRHAAREIFGLAAFRVADYPMADRYMTALFTDTATPQDMRQRAQIMMQLLTPLVEK